MGLELAHVLVERVSGTTKAGNQGTPLPLRIIGIRFPFARTRTGRIACKTRFPWVWIVDISSDGCSSRTWTGESGGGYVRDEDGES